MINKMMSACGLAAVMLVVPVSGANLFGADTAVAQQGGNQGTGQTGATGSGPATPEGSNNGGITGPLRPGTPGSPSAVPGAPNNPNAPTDCVINDTRPQCSAR